MKRTLGLMLALLLIAATGAFAQDPTANTGSSTGTSTGTNTGTNTGTSTGTNTSTNTTTSTSNSGATMYALRDAYPKLKTLLEQTILLTGIPEQSARVGIWITLSDGGYTIPVVKNFSQLVSLGFFKSKVQLQGKFTYNTKLGTYVFEAVGYKTL